MGVPWIANVFHENLHFTYILLYLFLVCRCVTPYIRAFNVNFYCTARLFSSIVHCLCDPLYDSASLLFTKIFVNRVDNAQVGCH